MNEPSAAQVMEYLGVLKDLEALDLRISLAQMKPETQDVGFRTFSCMVTETSQILDLGSWTSAPP